MYELTNNELMYVNGGSGWWDVGMTAGIAIIGLATAPITATSIALAAASVAVVALCVTT